MRGRELVDAFALHADGHVALEGVLGDAGVEQIAHRRGPEVQGGVAAEDRGLHGVAAAVVQVAAEREAGHLPLGLVQQLARIVGGGAHREAVGGAEARRVGDLEAVVGVAADEADAILGAEDVVGVDEDVALVGAVVVRRGAAVRALDAELGAAELARDEEVGGAAVAAVLEARLVGPVAAAIGGHRAAVLEPALGADVDDAGGLQAVLGRQGAGDQAEAVDQARTERLAEHRNSLRQDDAVQPVLDAVVVVAHVVLAEAVLHHARQLQDHLVQLLVLAPRLRLDGGAVDGVGRGPQRRFDRLARGGEPLRGDHDLGDGVLVRRRFDGRRRIAAVHGARLRRPGIHLGGGRGGDQGDQARGAEQSNLELHSGPRKAGRSAMV